MPSSPQPSAWRGRGSSSDQSTGATPSPPPVKLVPRRDFPAHAVVGFSGRLSATGSIKRQNYLKGAGARGGGLLAAPADGAAAMRSHSCRLRSGGGAGAPVQDVVSRRRSAALQALARARAFCADAGRLAALEIIRRGRFDRRLLVGIERSSKVS